MTSSAGSVAASGQLITISGITGHRISIAYGFQALSGPGSERAEHPGRAAGLEADQTITKLPNPPKIKVS